MGKNALKYILACLCTFLTLCAIEVFLLSPVVDFIGFSFKVHLIVYLTLFIIVNPIITRFLIGLLSISRLPEEQKENKQI